MTAIKRDIYVEQGASFSLSFVWNTGTVLIPGAPVDLTGAVARMQMRKSQKSPVILDARSTGVDPKITLGGVTGQITLFLTDEDTDLLTVRTTLYDFEVEMSDGVVFRLLEGNVTISANITQEDEDPPLGDA